MADTTDRRRRELETIAAVELAIEQIRGFLERTDPLVPPRAPRRGNVPRPRGHLRVIDGGRDA